MIAMGVTKKLVGGAAGVLGAAGAVASHLAWYIRYQATGSAQDGGDREA